MAVAHLVIYILSTVLVVSDANYVTPYSKCYSRDSECLRNHFQSVVSIAARHGIPEVGIPVLDPVVIKDYRVSIPGWYDIEIVEGVGQGMRTCVVNKFQLDFEKHYGAVELVCDLSVTGHYTSFSNSTLVRSLLNADSMYGDGIGQIKHDKLTMFYDFNFEIEHRGPDSFLNCDLQNSKFGIILGGVTFAADNIYIGDVEASELVIGVMNQYAKPMLEATGLSVMNGVVKSAFDYTRRYLHNTPLASYVIDSVTPYFFRWW